MPTKLVKWSTFRPYATQKVSFSPKGKKSGRKLWKVADFIYFPTISQQELSEYVRQKIQYMNMRHSPRWNLPQFFNQKLCWLKSLETIHLNAWSFTLVLNASFEISECWVSFQHCCGFWKHLYWQNCWMPLLCLDVLLSLFGAKATRQLYLHQTKDKYIFLTLT